MKVLITGANGFIAKNLRVTLYKMPQIEVLLYDKNDSIEQLENFIKEADFIFHLAGVNRPKNKEEFYEGNGNFTKILVNLIKKQNKKIPILLSSSTQVGSGSDYAKSKKEAEDIVLKYAADNNIACFIYRLPNVFGKWSKPNYNSVIATWCYNISRSIEIQVNDMDTKLNLVYIGDVIHSFIEHLYIGENHKNFYEVKTVYKKTLGEIKNLLYLFRDSRDTLLVPNIAKDFERVLYATYLSYLPEDKFSYKLDGHKDSRGTFYEILKTFGSGQLGISTTKPGITRGNHYHHTKNEKFLVLKGQALIELRNVLSDKVIRYYVSGNEMEIVEMIPGYTHNITNTGDEEMILLIWANENYNPDAPDTNFLEV
jgi:UDP-2-acetamido-2,6-beta-L-arabino-hexul-4-ose reductase